MGPFPEVTARRGDFRFGSGIGHRRPTGSGPKRSPPWQGLKRFGVLEHSRPPTASRIGNANFVQDAGTKPASIPLIAQLFHRAGVALIWRRFGTSPWQAD